MTETVQESDDTVTEVVGLYHDREHFDQAVAALLQHGFPRDALSVLASHDELSASETDKPHDPSLTALVGELKYAFPLTTAGFIAIAGGPVSAALAAIFGAGLAGIAAKDYLDAAAAEPHVNDFERALQAGGVILWVRVESAEETHLADETLRANGGSNVHIVERPRGEQD